MKQLTTLLNNTRRAILDDQGGEVMEYALILGLVSVVVIVTIGAVGTRVVARWSSVNSSM